MISLLQSASFFPVHFIIVLFECFKLISSNVSSLFLLDIWCHWSRLTIDSCLLHACSRACFVRVYYMHVIELVLFNDELNQEINCYLLIHVCNVLQSLFYLCLLHLIELVLFIDWLNQEINYRLVFITDSLQVTSLTTRSIIICSCSRLTILIIQADSFYSALNIQWWTSFSSYLRDFRHVVYVQFFQDI